MSTHALWVLIAAIGYLLALYATAAIGDRFAQTRALSPRWRATMHGLAMGVYCSTWTVFGAIGTASREGWGYLPIYLGPLLVLALAPYAWARVVRLQQFHRLGSLADFLGARFGRQALIPALVASVSLLAVLPYLALQLRALEGSLAALAVPHARLATALALAISVLITLRFGVRDANAVQRRPGLVLVLAIESTLKLLILLLLAAWAYFQEDLLRQPLSALPMPAPFVFASQTLLAGLALMALPRMYHVGVVECAASTDIPISRAVFALYLVLVSVAVLPLVALTGGSPAGSDFLLISLPLSAGQPLLATLAFVAGLSAASAMMIASLLALSTMVSNSLVTPLMLRFSIDLTASRVLWTRRIAVLVTAAASFFWLELDAGSSTLAQMGLLAFAAVAQFAPIMLAGLISERLSTRVATAALASGACAWLFGLWLPQLLHPGGYSNAELAIYAFYALAANTSVLLLGQWLFPAQLRERLGAGAFLDVADRVSSMAATRIRLDDVLALLERVLGPSSSQRLLEQENVQGERAVWASPALLQAAELALSEVLGNASARALLMRTLGGQQWGTDSLLDVLDRSARRVRISESLLKATFEHMHQAVSVVDAEQNLVAWNTSYEALFEWPSGLLRIGRPIADLLHVAATQSGMDPATAEARASRRLVQLAKATPYRSLRNLPDGRWLDIRGEPLPGGGFVTTFFDVSESVVQAQALLQANQLLEQRVTERTLQLEQINAQKNRFVAAASHDLLQPLSAARLYLSAVRDGAQDPSLLTRVDAALAAGEDLLSGLTDLSRLDAGQLRPQMERFALDPLLQALIEQYQPQANGRALLLRYAPTSRWVYSDARLLRRIVSNYLANALRYTASGSVLLGVRRQQADVRVVVLDTGAGLTQELAAEIFNDRSESGSRSPWGERGLGLGLAGCRRLAEIMDAKLSVDSQPGHGSCFAIALTACAPASVSAPPESPAQAGAGGSVLVVDNDPEVRISLTTLLQTWGMRVSSAASSAEALLRAAEDLPEWAVVDYALGESSNGLDLIAVLSRQQPGLRCALLTAESDPELPSRAKSIGAHFLKKPVRPATLRLLLRS